MNVLCAGLSLLIALISAASPQEYRVRRFVSTGQRGNNDWNWNAGGQVTNGQAKSASQTAWPKGDAPDRRSDSKTNKDSRWTTEGWSSTDVQQKEDNDIVWNTQPQGNDKGSDYPQEKGDLQTLLRGVPGMDFPDFLAIPDTSFDCGSVSSQGYYGDVEAGCQVFHICQPGNRKDSFLCPVGTIFNQKYFVCDWWFNVNCSDTMSYYNLNDDVYKDKVVPEEVSPTTEKSPQMPWNAQDLDKKRPPSKSWGPQPSTGKQNIPRKDIATKRGAKSDSSTTQAINSWSRSDVQKEVTLSWSTSGNYGSPSISSKTLAASTAKPIWYGIDGQPSKDQSDAMRRRNGLVKPNAPFGTRMKSGSSSMATAGTWTPTDVFQPTTSPRKASTFHASTTTRDWLSSENLPKTSIVPTGVKGVWDLETTRKSDQDTRRRHDQETSRSDQDTNPSVIGRRGIVTKSESFSHQRQQSFVDHSKDWGQRQTLLGSSTDPMDSSATSARYWRKSTSKLKRGQRLNVRRKPASSDINSIPRPWH